ncbi:RCC1 and BTB domain containing protein claret isoform 1-T1 [Glossina fuscipes fuscipes]
MTSPLQQLDIFELRPLITNFCCKLSTVTEYNDNRQLLCLVAEENDIVLRYTNASGLEILKLISWFRRTNQVIHEVCFDPSGTWLLVLCFDNTLHIVPALAVVDKSFLDSTVTDTQLLPFSTSQVTSYIIPFVGPHECPNSKRCPNPTTTNDRKSPNTIELSSKASVNQQAKGDENDKELPKQMESTNANEAKRSSPVNELIKAEDSNIESLAQNIPKEMLDPQLPTTSGADKTGNSQVKSTSFMASNTCPYPLSVKWWRTSEGAHRAIIGYSDGSICFVDLSPNCPFVASTAIETGSVVKLVICRDITFESVLLLITSSLKQQFKLLLEQKTIKFTYPGDISPSIVQPQDDWQIVMPLKTTNTQAASLGQEYSAIEDAIPKTEESYATENKILKQSEQSFELGTTGNKVNQLPPAPFGYTSTVNSQTNSNKLPPPYSVAVNRSMDCAPVTNIASQSKASSSQSDTLTTNSVVRFQQTNNDPDLEDSNGIAGGIFPAARARLASLKSLGSKKLNAIKMRLSDNRQKLEEYMPENAMGSFAIIDSPSLLPELLIKSGGSFYTIQSLRGTYLLSALHSHSNSLSVHSIDINLKPLFLYKIPHQCVDILISSNILYSIQYVDINSETKSRSNENTEKENRDTDIEKQEQYSKKQLESNSDHSDEAEESIAETSSASTYSERSASSLSPSNSINAVGIISSAMASLRTGESDKFNKASLLALYRFENETVLNLHQMATYRTTALNETISKDDKDKAFEYKEIRSPMDYVKFYEKATDVREEYSLRQMEIMQNEFPKINFDPCYVITNKNIYCIQFKKEPFAIFLDAALAGEWTQCREFCNTFDLTYEMCIEFAGDYLLRRRKIPQALLTYNAARIKPIRTALKLAMFGHTTALMHLCAMALKLTYILKSRYFCHPVIKTLLPDITYRHSEDVRPILPPTPKSYSANISLVSEGLSCSDYVYGEDDSLSNPQMSPSSQFHLANLLLITLAEKAVNDKNYMPLWNFLVTNAKYHTNMSSIVLCQSGLFSSALVLAKIRGVCIDTFLALASVVGQEFGWYTELNACLYNASELIFVETISYVPNIAIDYFAFIQEKMFTIRPQVLERLERQLNPFSAILRPIVSHTSNLDQFAGDNNTYNLEFCKNLIETYLAILIYMDSRCSSHGRLANALSTFRLTYEDNQFAIESTRFKPISAGCAHCACIVDGVAYFWGSNGVPCNYSVSKSSDPPEPPHAVKKLELLAQLNLEVHAVKCGRQHTLILTNNGLYSLGNNNLLQLGIGTHMQMTLQPMLVRTLDGMDITILEAGQYHNAVVANGLLLTWGWNIYGQLGHGGTENVAEPKVVPFFKFRKILQVSLGHAHSLVLCQSSNEAMNTELFVFGSNHFGQLGLGPRKLGQTHEPHTTPAEDESYFCDQAKCLLPQKIEFSTANIRLIHTKFFTNLAVDEKGYLYTWGSSPQALRLANQIRRRANAKQKLEEYQRREMSKRFEATMNTASSSSTDSIVDSSEKTSSSQSPQVEKKKSSTITLVPEETTTPPAASKLPPDGVVMEDLAVADVADNIEIVENEVMEEILPGEKNSVDDDVEQRKHTESSEKTSAAAPGAPNPTVETDLHAHMSPHLVDTTEVAGQILQVSSGLFHFALISSSRTLYTWGKNLEHQLGTEDKERRAVNKPSPIDNIENPMFVDCGADFTLVMSTDYMVRAFGGNSNGQCGRDLGASIDKMKQRVVCLPTTKRLMRFESQCIEIPVEINLPRPRIRLGSERVRYLKSIPRYQSYFVQEADINFEDYDCDDPSPSRQYKLTTQSDITENALTDQESEDLLSSLENISDATSMQSSINPLLIKDSENSSCEEEESLKEQIGKFSILPQTDNASSDRPITSKARNLGNDEDIRMIKQSSSLDHAQQQFRLYIHYCLYIFHGLYDIDKIREFSKDRLEYRIRTLMLNFKFIDAFALCLQDVRTSTHALKVFEYFSKDTGYVPLRRADLRFLIYHLFMHFIDRKYKMDECESFFLADLDYYLVELAYVLYFNNNNTVLEQSLNEKFKHLFAQRDGSSDNLDVGVDNQINDIPPTYKLDETDLIFDHLGVKFKTTVCQRLLKHCNN